MWASRRLILTGLIAVLLCGVAGAQSGLNDARRDIARLRYDEAESKLADLAKSSSGSRKQEALYLLAGLKRSPSEAEIIYEEVVRIDPSSTWASEANLELAKMQYASGNYSDALMILDQSDACRDLDEACFFNGLSSLQLGRYGQAKDALSRVRRGRFRSWAYLSLAEIDMKTDNPDEACRRYESMSRASLSPTAMYRYGECLEKDGEPDRARKIFQDLITSFRHTPEAIRAAEKLSLIDDKAQTVQQEVAERESAPETKKQFESGGFTIQFGAFSDRTNAIKLAADLKRDLAGVRIDSDVVNFKEIHRVRYGYFATREEALAKSEEIAKLTGEPNTIMMLK